ncbi:MAG: hypothetical protein HY720_14960 [Planctomycetes bacterium]|nr:hypothetical protein [Planctomycetota bacterium]
MSEIRFPESPPEKCRPLLPPGRFAVLDSQEDLRIRWRWFSPLWAGLLCFYLLLGVWLAGNFSGDLLKFLESADALLLAVVVPFLVLFAVLFAGLIYWTLAGIVNATEISIRDARVRVRHAPLPWPGAWASPAGEILRLDCRKLEGTRESMLLWKSYSVLVEFRDGRRATLAARLQSAEDALALASAIEKRLGIGEREETPASRGSTRPKRLGKTIQVACPKCGQVVRASDMDLGNLLARCSHCDVVFPFESDLDSLVQLEEPRGVPGGPEAPPPRGLFVQHSPAELRLWWRWLSWSSVVQFAVCIFIDVIWFITGPGAPARWLRNFEELPNAALQIVFAGCCLWANYVAIAALVNGSEIAVSGDSIQVRHGPLPWPGQRRLPMREILRLSCTEHKSQLRQLDWGPTYALRASMRKGRIITLASGIEKAELALYLAAKIEERLGIGGEE